MTTEIGVQLLAQILAEAVKNTSAVNRRRIYRGLSSTPNPADLGARLNLPETLVNIIARDNPNLETIGQTGKVPGMISPLVPQVSTMPKSLGEFNLRMAQELGGAEHLPTFWNNLGAKLASGSTSAGQAAQRLGVSPEILGQGMKQMGMYTAPTATTSGGLLSQLSNLEQFPKAVPGPIPSPTMPWIQPSMPELSRVMGRLGGGPGSINPNYAAANAAITEAPAASAAMPEWFYGPGAAGRPIPTIPPTIAPNFYGGIPAGIPTGAASAASSASSAIPPSFPQWMQNNIAGGQAMANTPIPQWLKDAVASRGGGQQLGQQVGSQLGYATRAAGAAVPSDLAAAASGMPRWGSGRLAAEAAAAGQAPMAAGRLTSILPESLQAARFGLKPGLIGLGLGTVGGQIIGKTVAGSEIDRPGLDRADIGAFLEPTIAGAATGFGASKGIPGVGSLLGTGIGAVIGAGIGLRNAFLPNTPSANATDYKSLAMNFIDQNYTNPQDRDLAKMKLMVAAPNDTQQEYATALNSIIGEFQTQQDTAKMYQQGVDQMGAQNYYQMALMQKQAELQNQQRADMVKQVGDSMLASQMYLADYTRPLLADIQNRSRVGAGQISAYGNTLPPDQRAFYQNEANDLITSGNLMADRAGLAAQMWPAQAYMNRLYQMAPVSTAPTFTPDTSAFEDIMNTYQNKLQTSLMSQLVKSNTGGGGTSNLADILKTMAPQP